MGNASNWSGRHAVGSVERPDRSTRPERRVCLPASDLIAGNEIRSREHGIVRALSEPDLVHRGLSPFDQLEVLAGVRVEAVAGAESAAGQSSYLILRLDQRVPIVHLTAPRQT